MRIVTLVAVVVLALVGVLGCSRDGGGSGSGAGSGSGSTERLVTLTPSATEIVAALGATELLVGVDDYSTYPAGVAALPKIGAFQTPNLEAIVRLRPTLVIADDVHADVARALGDAGIATLECPMHALPDVKLSLRKLGDRLGRAAEATRVLADIDAAMDEARARQPARRVRVLLVIDRASDGLGNMTAAGPGSWLDEVAATTGAENVLASSGARYPKITLEEILRGNPDVIIDVSYSAKDGDVAAWKVPELARVPAVRDGRVRALFLPFLEGPSPRVREALNAVAGALR